MSAALHSTMQAAYPVWAETEGGKAFEADGGTLGALLREVGIKVDNLYAESRVTAENLAETMKERGALYGPSASELNTKAKAEEKARHEAAKPKPVEVSETFDPSIKPEDIQKLIEAERAIFPVVEPVPSSGDELETKLLQRKANVQDVAVFCRETPELTYQQAEERGLIAKGEDGAPQATWVMGATIAEHAPEALFQSYTSGEKTQLQAYKLAAEISTGEFSVQVAREAGLMPEGKLEASNGTLYTIGSSSFAILARHASPHHGIRKFLMEFIGTGEGAQVYGHGLYFSTALSVHKWYKKSFDAKAQNATSNGRIIQPTYRDKGGDEIDLLGNLRRIPFSTKPAKRASIDKWKETVYRQIDRQLDKIWNDWIPRMEEKLAKLEAKKSAGKKLGRHQEWEYSHLYGLIEDYKQDAAALEEARGKLKLVESVEPPKQRQAAEYEVMLNFERNGENLLRLEGFVPQEVLTKIGMYEGTHVPATDLLWMMGVDLGSPQAAAERLLAAGIKGIEYRDGTSRRSDKDVTYNYVLFDENDCKIVRVKDEQTGYEWQDYTDAGATFALNIPLTPEMKAIKKRAIAEGQIIKNADGSLTLFAPNGKPSNLTERQWFQVRTAAFKDWFGDWETLAKIMAVRGMEAVAVTPHESLDKNQMKEAFHGFGDVENKRSGRVAKFPSKSAGKIFYHKGFDSSSIVRHMAVLFEDSVLAFSENETPREGHKEHRNYESYEQYVNKFSVNGDEYFIRFTVPIVRNSKESANVHSTAISQVTIYRKGDSVLYLPETAGKAESPLADKKLASFFASVNEKDVSKVVDENGEPLVVYHGAPLDFGNTFKDVSDKAWRLQFDPNYSEDTYWFADNKFTAQTYQIGLFTTPRSIERKKVSAASRKREPLKKEVVSWLPETGHPLQPLFLALGRV